MTTPSGPSDPSSAHSPRPDWEAVARFLADENSTDEAEQIRGWLEQHPDDANVVNALDRTLDRLAAESAAPIDVEAALAQVRARRDHPEVRALKPRTAHPFARPSASWPTTALRIAAAMVLVAGVALVWERSQREPAGTPVVNAPASKIYVTPVGSRDSVRLPDGSLVVLGPGSRLVVPASYGTVERAIDFHGEGFFDVLHDDAHGFVVRSGTASIRDVGTKFVVRNSDSVSVSVTVREGAVLLRGESDTLDRDAGVVLHGGDVGDLQQGGRPRVRRGVSSEDDVAWMSGRLVFREASLDDVAAELRRWYGIELRVPDSTLAGRHLTASFAGESRQRVLQVISLALGASAELHGDTVVLRARGGNVDSGRRKPPSPPDSR